jgi:hypothetical protein
MFRSGTWPSSGVHYIKMLCPYVKHTSWLKHVGFNVILLLKFLILIVHLVGSWFLIYMRCTVKTILNTVTVWPSFGIHGGTILCNEFRGCLVASHMWSDNSQLTSEGCEGSGHGLMSSEEAEEHHTRNCTWNTWCLCWDLNWTPEYKSEA